MRQSRACITPSILDWGAYTLGNVDIGARVPEKA